MILCIKRGVKHNVIQVQRKAVDSQKVYSQCPPLARTQACKRVCHWSTLSSMSDFASRGTHAADTVTAYQCHELSSHTHVAD